MAHTSTHQDSRQALAAQLRELRTRGLDNRPLNRKELGRLLGEAMNRPAGAYAARRVGDFENPEAKSPPPADALRGYARVFGEPLEDELLALRRGIDAPPVEATPGRHRGRKALAAAAAAGTLVLAVAGFLLLNRSEPSPRPTFCARNTEIRVSPGAVAVVCARDVRVRPSPSAPAEDALGTLSSGARFTVDRYSPSGAWVHGHARLDDGRETDGWVEAGWFCPPAGAGGSSATACRTS